MDTATLDAAFTALEQYKQGSGRGPLVPLDEAVAASLTQPEAHAKLEARLAQVLEGPSSAAAKEYVCRKLALAGSARSVPALAALLEKEGVVFEAARTALQAMACPEARGALRNSLGKLSGVRKAGVLNSLGACRDAESVPALKPLLVDSDGEVAAAAAAALGEIGTKAAAEALAVVRSKAERTLGLRFADAQLACAERLLAAGLKAEALAIYKPLSDPQQPAQVQLAAKRGLLRAIQQKDS